MALVFEQPVRIRWSHCDPAGIVYHPQYFVILNGLMEDFFRECTDLSYEESVRQRFGFPIVGIRSDFCVPSRHGEECIGKVWIESIGRTSVRFALTLECEGEVRVQATETRSDFCVPSRHGEECIGKVWIESIGRTSVRFALTLECEGEVRVQATETAVCVEARGKKLEKTEIPAELRAAFEKYLSTETLPLRA